MTLYFNSKTGKVDVIPNYDIENTIALFYLDRKMKPTDLETEYQYFKMVNNDCPRFKFTEVWNQYQECSSGLHRAWRYSIKRNGKRKTREAYRNMLEFSQGNTIFTWALQTLLENTK